MPRTRKLAQSQLMLQAGESGNTAAQRAHDSRQQRGQQTADRTERGRQFDESVRQQELNRYASIWDRQRQDRNQRARDLADRQDAKPRGTNFGNEGTLQQGSTPEQDQMAQQQQQFEMGLAENARQFDVSTDLRAAQSGLQQTGEGAPSDPRLQSMMEEMARGRGQMEQGLEQTAQGGRFVPTADSKMAGQAAQDTERFKAETSRMAEITKRRKNERDYELAEIRLGAASGGAAKKEAQAALDLIDKNLLQAVISGADMVARLEGNKGTGTDWKSLREEVAGDPDVGQHAETMKEIEAGYFGENLSRFLSEKQGKQGVVYTAGTGSMPSGKLVNYASESMQRLVAQIKVAAVDIIQGTSAELASPLTESEKITIINKTAAKAVLEGKDAASAQPAGEQIVTEEDQRNMSQSEQGIQKHVQRSPTDAAGEAVGPPVNTVTREWAANEAGEDPNQAWPDIKAERPSKPKLGYPGTPRAARAKAGR